MVRLLTIPTLDKPGGPECSTKSHEEPKLDIISWSQVDRMVESHLER